MIFTSQSIPDIVVIEPIVHGDNRGYFIETFRQDKLIEALGYNVNFIQDNESKSNRGVLRGLHYQTGEAAQSKLVRVIQGSVLDVAVDIRLGSPTFGQYIAMKLSGDNKRQMFIPRGFAHGFVVLEDNTIFSYKVDSHYSPENDHGIAFDDEDLKIDWIIPSNKLLLSKKDLQQPSLKQADLFNYEKNYYD